MTPEQRKRKIRELELELELAHAREAEAAQAAATVSPSPQQAAPATPSASRSGVLGFAQGGTFGFADEIGGLLGKLLIGGERARPGVGAAIAPDDTPEVRAAKESLAAQASATPSVYQLTRDLIRREDAAAQEAHPWAYAGGTIAGGLATAPLLPGAGQARTLGQVVKQGAKVGAGAGGAYGLGASGADLTRGEYWRAAGDATLGAILGGGIGAGVPVAAKGAGWAARNVGAPVVSLLRGGYVKPTPEAQRLMAEGAKLTLGQMDPGGFPLGRLEELAAAKWTGGGVARMRDEGVSTVRDALLQKTAAPGATPPTRGAPVMSQLDEIAQGFAKGYADALDGVRIQPEKYLGKGKWRGLVTDETMTGSAKTKGAFELAAESKSINASDDVRRRALGWLKNEATSLVPTKSGPNAGTVDARAVQQLRTRLRDEIRSLGDTGDDRATKQIYQRAEEFVTELLEGQLPAENAARLRALDGSYRNKLAAERAAMGAKAFKEGEGGEFTATQFLEAIRRGGATPELEALARDAHRVTTARYTPTGMMAHGLEAVPLSEYFAAPAAYLANRFPRHALKTLVPAGLPARALAATGRAIEGAAQQPRATSAAYRTLYDLLRQDEALPMAVSQ